MEDSISARKTTRIGILYGFAAFAFWGLTPIYFKAINIVPPLEVLAHRIVWSVLFLTILVSINKQWGLIRAAVRIKQVCIVLAITTILIATNWFVFIYAIVNNQILQASLGYFINPLVSILLGVVILHEKLTKWAKLSVFLAFVGVVFQAIQGVGLPWIALLLAFSFGFYGLLRKTVKINAVAGLTIETALLAPFMLIYIIYLGSVDTGHFGTTSWEITLLLLSAGVITSAPLVWFTKAARRLNLSTVGFLQYIAPSLNFVLALGYGEAFTFSHAVSFGCIWTALIIYSIDSVRNSNEV